ncbi:tetratricopeptide repeat protein [Chlamydiota bacterium]
MCKRLIILLTLLAFTAACARVPTYIEPVVQAPPHPKEIQREKRFMLCLPPDFSLSPFAPLTPEEQATDWGKEYRIALCFADDFDLYRAITGFKRALCLIPPEFKDRQMEIQYMVALAYFLGQKYVEVVYAVESTGLICVESTFPAWRDLLLILYESYEQLGRPEHAAHMVNLLEQQDPEAVCKLNLLSAVKQADFDAMCHEAQVNPQHAYLDNIMCGYRTEAKSVRKAQTLNALLPGAGYWYVGLKQTALTAFIINGLFIAAGVQLICEGHGAAGAIVLSLEGGWYFGGIAGAGWAAKSYNERLYCTYANKITQREEYFPRMMLNYTF